MKNGRNWNEFTVEEIASRTAEYATELFGAKKIEGGKIPVILSERISARFLSMYSQPFMAETMQKGQSRLDGKEGEKIASDLKSIAVRVVLTSNETLTDDLINNKINKILKTLEKNLSVTLRA